MRTAARFSDALGLAPGPSCIICLVGGGGKTTAMFRIAEELKAAGSRVLVTTTTNIFMPGPDQCDEFMLEGCADPGSLAGRAAGTITCLGNGIIEKKVRKIKSVDPAFIDGLSGRGFFDVILNEADGAKRKPVKAPAGYEPVIPASTSLVIGVIGLDCLGKPVSEGTVHRSELFCACTGKKPGEPIDGDCIVKLITADNGLFKDVPAGCRKAVLLNKADTPALQEQGEQIAQELVRLQEPVHGCIVASLQQGSYSLL